jgi:hypothetical protein
MNCMGEQLLSPCMGKNDSAWYTILYNSPVWIIKGGFLQISWIYYIIESN